MQTFLTHPLSDQGAIETFMKLDSKRLGKQRVEAKQIIIALTEGRGWIHHPATKMWRGHVGALGFYGMLACHEWASRGFNDGLYDYFAGVCESHQYLEPAWGDDVRIIESHRSNLVHKLPSYYGRFWPEYLGRPVLPYLWPSATGTLHLSQAQLLRSDWELPTTLRLDRKTREVTNA